MRSKQTMFFSLSGDLEPVLAEVEKDFDIEYVKMGGFETKERAGHGSFLKIPNFGTHETGFWLTDHNYLMKPKDLVLNVEEFRMSKGGVRFTVDQKLNPASVELTTGGIYTRKENVLVAGRVATVSDDSFSLVLYKALSSKIKKNFKRIGVFYVGPKAEEKLREGWRLTTDVKSPKEYDLAYPT